MNLYTSGQTNTGQVTVIYKGLVDEQQHSLSFSSIPAMMSRILGLTTARKNWSELHCHQENQPCTATVVSDEADKHGNTARGTQDGVRGCQAPHPPPTTLRSKASSPSAPRPTANVTRSPSWQDPRKEEGHVSHERIRSLRRVGLNVPIESCCGHVPNASGEPAPGRRSLRC